MEKIFPSVKQGQLVKSIDERVTGQYIIQLFDGNQVTIFDIKSEETKPIEFSVPCN